VFLGLLMLLGKALVKHGSQISTKYWYLWVEDNMKKKVKKYTEMITSHKKWNTYFTVA